MEFQKGDLEVFMLVRKNKIIFRKKRKKVSLKVYFRVKISKLEIRFLEMLFRKNECVCVCVCFFFVVVKKNKGFLFLILYIKKIFSISLKRHYTPKINMLHNWKFK